MNVSRSLSAPVRFSGFDLATIVRSLLAITGSALLIVGVSLPTAVYRYVSSGETAGEQSYFDDASGDAAFVVLLAATMLVACLFRRLIWMRVAGALALGFFALSFALDLTSEPTILTTQTVIEGYGWGWLVLWAGAALAACAGWIGYERRSPASRD